MGRQNTVRADGCFLMYIKKNSEDSERIQAQTSNTSIDKQDQINFTKL
ncbi:MAG: hypothetical protein KDD00_15585 [Ignavibacteriae bacterium]|nr:hypothetical protein [Ignavibacteriota bacterium]